MYRIYCFSCYVLPTKILQSFRVDAGNNITCPFVFCNPFYYFVLYLNRIKFSTESIWRSKNFSLGLKWPIINVFSNHCTHLIQIQLAKKKRRYKSKYMLTGSVLEK